MWEFPGGKLDPGESLLEGASRELREELAIEVESIGATLRIIRDPGSEFAIHFVEARASGDPVPLEHVALRWCTLEELRDMPLAPADAHFAETLLS
jgi:8-oxo-dGTP pyrophosphatase MutT (NUDIX family)